MTERPDLHAWANAEMARQTHAVPRAWARRGAAAGQVALIALIAGAVAGTVLLCAVLQRVVLLGFMLQLIGASYWAGIAIWGGIAAVAVLAGVGVLSRWWLLLPLALVGWGMMLSVASRQRAATIAAAWRAEAHGHPPLVAPLPVPRGTAPYDLGAQRVGGLNGALLQPRDDRFFYAVQDAPCPAPDLPAGHVDARPALRRLAPLLRGLERQAGKPRGALCVRQGTGYGIQIEQRSLEGEGNWANPVRGVETIVTRDSSDEPVVQFRHGEIDALPLLPFISYGCRYGLNAELKRCGWFALTRAAARTG